MYHSGANAELAHEGSGLLIAFFRLTPKDIAEMDFRNIIEIEGQRYRLNRILRYDPTGNSTTAVELIRLIHTAPFMPSTAEVNNGRGEGGPELIVLKRECCLSS